MISNKLIGLASLVILCGTAGFTAVGCSSTNEVDVEDTDGGPTTNSSSGGKDKDGGKTTSGGSSGEQVVEAPACYDETAGLQLKNPKPGKSPGACGAGKVDAFWTLIFADADPNADKDAAAAEQDAFFDENPACVTCLLGAGDWDGDGDYTPPADAKASVLVLQDTSAYLNSGACIAAAAGVDEACGAAVINQSLCLNTSCSDCEEEADYTSCQEAALAEDQFCGSVVVPEGCIDALNAKEADITAACTGGAAGFEGAFKRNAAFLCN